MNVRDRLNELNLVAFSIMFSHFFSLILHELNRNCLLLIPLSYIIYRLTRTFLALLEAFLIYFVAPLFYTPNLDIYVNRWTAVSGGTDGIGKAYIFELAKLGLRKFILIGRSENKLNAVKEEIESQYKNSCVETILFDFNNAIYPEYADKLRREFSQFNIGFALNSVGVGREFLERFGDRPEADRQLFRVNAFGAVEFISAVLPSMERYGGGQIVVLSSSQGFRPIPLLAAYSATKSFVSFISEAVDREYSTISVQCLTPALVATNMTYYKSGSLFVVTLEKFAKQAIGTLGLVKMTSGCFNHEIQLLIRHLFPWSLLKYLVMPIYWHHQRRMIKLHGNINSNNSLKTKFNSNTSQRISKIPTPTTTNIGEVTFRNRA
uniref:Uncharacterized protein n=1 Tax=Meloidogyne enterolobii TaxID=390850 RepID=A0A6V7VLN3_MELEN|nr:unnamed protein product [Meloidogyne enterolobii]